MNNQEYTSQLYRAIANKMVADGFVNGAAMQRLKLATTKARDWLDNKGGRRYAKTDAITLAARKLLLNSNYGIDPLQIMEQNKTKYMFETGHSVYGRPNFNNGIYTHDDPIYGGPRNNG